jgi:hypothetical protein
MPALSPVKKESVGLGGSRMGTKKRLQQRELSYYFIGPWAVGLAYK